MSLTAALYDIHGNLPALEAVLDEISRMRVQRIVVGGDVLPGPMPRQTLARLLQLDIPVKFIQGNGEIAVLDENAGRKAEVPEHYRPAIRWSAEQLGCYIGVLRTPSFLLKSVKLQATVFG